MNRSKSKSLRATAHSGELRELVRDGVVNRQLVEYFEKTPAPVDADLIGALRKHPDPLMREVCASILGERRSRKAIPALLNALDDDSPHVRSTHSVQSKKQRVSRPASCPARCCFVLTIARRCGSACDPGGGSFVVTHCFGTTSVAAVITSRADQRAIPRAHQELLDFQHRQVSNTVCVSVAQARTAQRRDPGC